MMLTQKNKLSLSEKDNYSILGNMVSEKAGKYTFHRSVTEKEIITLAKNLLESRIVNYQSLSGSEIVKDFCIAQFSNEEDENFGVIFLTHDFKFIAFKKLFKGTVNKMNIYPRSIVRTALKYNAARIVLTHNHPSGDMNFSEEDIEITKRLMTLLRELDITVVDHIVIGHGKAKSMANEMLIRF